MISAVVPLVWRLIELARNRKVDVISMLVRGIGLSLVAIAFGGSPKLLLFRESLITGLIGLVMIGSAVVRRPLMRVLSPRRHALFPTPNSDVAAVLPNAAFARAREELESYADKPWFLRIMSIMTVVLGLILVTKP